MKEKRNCFGKIGSRKDLLKKAISARPLKTMMLSDVTSVAPRGFFQAPRSAWLKNSISALFIIHPKAQFTSKHIYALVAVHTFIEKKFNNMNFKVAEYDFLRCYLSPI